MRRLRHTTAVVSVALLILLPGTVLAQVAGTYEDDVMGVFADFIPSGDPTCHEPGDESFIRYRFERRSLLSGGRWANVAIEDAAVEFDDGSREPISHLYYREVADDRLTGIDEAIRISLLSTEYIWLPLEQLDIGDSQTLTARLTISSNAGHSGLELVSKTVAICGTPAAEAVGETEEGNDVVAEEPPAIENEDGGEAEPADLIGNGWVGGGCLLEGGPNPLWFEVRHTGSEDLMLRFTDIHGTPRVDGGGQLEALPYDPENRFDDVQTALQVELDLPAGVSRTFTVPVSQVKVGDSQVFTVAVTMSDGTNTYQVSQQFDVCYRAPQNSTGGGFSLGAAIAVLMFGVVPLGVIGGWGWLVITAEPGSDGRKETP